VDENKLEADAEKVKEEISEKVSQEVKQLETHTK
jgi:hypothetical protein